MNAITYYVSSLACFLSFVLATFLATTTYATTKSLYVVYMGAHPQDTIMLTDEDRDDRVMRNHTDFLGSFLESPSEAKDVIIYSYKKHINGFAATLSHNVASRLSDDPKVVSVFLNKGIKLHTTRSWDFLGLQDNGKNSADSLWEKAKFGANTIIGNLDTGVWPESESFTDEEMEEIPSKWKGICQNDFNKNFRCNRKLIGARYFNEGFRKFVGPLNSTFDTPIDVDGHGSHTLSTAGGNFVAGANILGFGNGTAKGGSPKARVASYKVCWSSADQTACTDADILAAFDMAIHDGVDVLSVSIGGGATTPFYEDSVAIGSFHAVEHGIVVVTSAGNSGPNLGTVENVAPWHITVGANTMDRKFPSIVILDTKTQFTGESLSDKSLPSKKQFPIIYAGNAKAANATTEDAEVCQSGALDGNKVKGKILVCLRGINERVDKGRQAALAGAVGMVLVNDEASGNELEADAHVLPATHITHKDGVALLSYVNSISSPVAKLTKPTTKLGTKPAPIMAAFSSAGPNPITPEILKPDITAPGVSIIAAYTGAQSPTEMDFDMRRVNYTSESGTSMSCPHISGVVGLLKTLHPKWSPAAIKSAIMTTASTLDNTLNPIKDASNGTATPFQFGAGHVQPNRAMDPGLVYNLSITDHLDFLCAIGYNETLIQLLSDKPHTCSKSINPINFNYPSVTIPSLNGTSKVTVTRKVTNVGSPGTYNAHIKCPPGVSVTIEPNTLKFESVGEMKVFNIYIHAEKDGGLKDYVFGEFAWCDGNNHYVRSPIVVKQKK